MAEAAAARLNPVREDYLRALWVLREEAPAGPLRPGALAKSLGLAKSTVSERLAVMHRDGWITVNGNGDLGFSAAGEAEAMRLTRRHRILEVFLADTLGVGPDDLHREAHLLEHGVSEAVLGRMESFLHQPARCPHGRPIPYA